MSAVIKLQVDLVGVTFAGGGTATGYFELNYNTTSNSLTGSPVAGTNFDIVTTPGVSTTGASLPGFEYKSSGLGGTSGATFAATGTAVLFKNPATGNPILNELNINFASALNSLATGAITSDTISFTNIFHNPIVPTGTGGFSAECQGGGTICGSATASTERVITGGSAVLHTFSTPIPEPVTLGMFGLGAAAIGFVRRRKTD
jgi:hypothetical protein